MGRAQFPRFEAGDMQGSLYPQQIICSQRLDSIQARSDYQHFGRKPAVLSGKCCHCWRRRMAQRNQKDWRELCTAVANETDSNKLGSLVQELIKALDERDQNWRSPIDPFSDSRAVA